MRLIYLVVLLLAGCQTYQPNPNETKIMFYSNPAGATITAPGITYGAAPRLLIWTFTDEQTTLVTAPITATWVSGATTTTRINITKGKDGSYVMQRPQGVAGLDSDIQWAIHIEQQDQQRQIAVQQQKQADDAAFANALKPAPSNKANCTSNVLGNQVFTNCY
jgi:hypothetical protein